MLILLPILFLTLCFGELIRISPLPSVAVTLLDVGIGVIFLFFLFRVITKKNFLKAKLTIPLTLFMTACVLSLIFGARMVTGNQLFVGALYFLRWIAYASIYFLVLRSSGKVKQILPFLMIGSALIL